MFVCERVARGNRYLHVVESVREGKQVRQRTIRALAPRTSFTITVLAPISTCLPSLRAKSTILLCLLVIADAQTLKERFEGLIGESISALDGIGER